MSVKSHLTSRISNRAINGLTYSECQSVCGDFSETTAFKNYGVKHELKSQYANILSAVSFLHSMNNPVPEVTQ